MQWHWCVWIVTLGRRGGKKAECVWIVAGGVGDAIGLAIVYRLYDWLICPLATVRTCPSLKR